MRTLVLAIATALALGACSGGGAGDGTGSSDAAPVVSDGAATFVGTDSLQWEEPSKATTVDEGGSLELTLECAGSVPHNVVFEGVDDDAIAAECVGDERVTTTVALEPGTYTFYCSIPGHRTAGMEGQITIS